MSRSRPPDERWSNFEESLLRAGRKDGPRRGSRRKAFVALGVGTGTALGSGATATSAAAGAASKIAWVAATKWVGVAAVALGTAALSVHLGIKATSSGGTTRATSQVEHAPSVASGDLRSNARDGMKEPPTPPDLAPSPSAESEPQPIPEVLAAPTQAPAVVANSPKRRGLATKVALDTESTAILSQETATLEAARTALRAGDAREALRRLDGYSATFPHGVLEPESSVLRIEAQVAAGDRAGADALGKQFLATFPQSPLATRVRALLLH